MICRTFFLLNFDSQLCQRCMQQNQSLSYLTHSLSCLNTSSWSSRNQLTRFNLLCLRAECCTQTMFTFLNNLKLNKSFLCMCKVLLFCCIRYSLNLLDWQIKVLVFVEKCFKAEIYLIGCQCSTVSSFASERD